MLAAGPSLGGPVPPQSADGIPGRRGDVAATRRGDVAAAPEVERLSPLPVGEPGDLPVELLFGAIALALIALAGMAVSVRRALR